jgi:hypothetical protein
MIISRVKGLEREGLIDLMNPDYMHNKGYPAVESDIVPKRMKSVLQAKGRCEPPPALAVRHNELDLADLHLERAQHSRGAERAERPECPERPRVFLREVVHPACPGQRAARARRARPRRARPDASFGHVRRARVREVLAGPQAQEQA